MRLADWIDTFTEWTGRILAWLMCLMVVATLAIVIVRYATANNTILLQEAVLYMHGFAFMLAIPYALKHDVHVRVDLVYGRLGPRGKAWIDLCGHLLLLAPTAIVIILYSRNYVANTWRIMEGSAEVGGIPGVFVLKTLIPVMAGLLLLQGLAEVIRKVLVLRRGHV
jgi:TRAP-type mannitol/chloroaromatic compound transport system permease small subunit